MGNYKLSLDDVIELVKGVKKWEKKYGSKFIGSHEDLAIMIGVSDTSFWGNSPIKYRISVEHDNMTIGSYQVGKKDPKFTEIEGLYKKAESNVKQQRKDKLKESVFHAKDLLKKQRNETIL